ncbi:MAG: M23 family metallopeptidase [Acidobacteria bacterium]|nr:M23 family metallopeptidase [Acidobacteriota bacterium]
MKRRLLILCLAAAAVGAAGLGVVLLKRYTAEREFAHQATLARMEADWVRSHVVLYSDRKVAAGVHFSESLQRMGLDAQSAAGVVGSAQKVFDLRRVRAGNHLSVGRSVMGELRAVRYQIDADRMLWVFSGDHGFHAEVRTIPSQTEVAGVTGTVRDSLFNAVIDGGESAEFAIRLAEIFGWDLDFYTDPREGDTFRVVVEKKKYLDGQTAAYGRILAAEYNNDGRPYQAVLFRDPAGNPAYYAPDGKSLQKAFLRSPLKFAAPITSHFSRSRFHPILKTRRPHLGIDYGAPVGTPVQAIGHGRVVFAGHKGGAGNLIELQHANGYETMYMHLSRLLVHSGQRVEQGQRIGLVGMTGLATGPHLDFRILQHGAYRNFEHLQLPPAQPVAKRDWNDFLAARQRWLTLLPEPDGLHARAAGTRAAASSQ